MSSIAPLPTPVPQLATAARIVQRHDGLLQIGIRPDACVRVADTPESRHILDEMSRGGPSIEGDLELIAALRDSGLIATPQPPGPFAVRVLGSLEADTTSALRWAGLAERANANLALHMSLGEFDRRQLDALVRTGTPHLLVRALDGVIILGPFVVPGRTACLRCIDAHHTDDDPGYRRALADYIAARDEPREDGSIDIVGMGDAALALAWAARDLRAFALGQTPTTWSTTMTIGDPHHPISATTWEPHPACGCRWADPAHLVA